MSKRNNSRFQRGSGVYTCRCCGKQTRETGQCESSCELCLACYEESGWENTHSDNDHENNPDPGCPICEREGLLKKAEHVCKLDDCGYCYECGRDHGDPEAS